MITSLRKLKCCCTSLYRADAVRYGMMMMLLVGGLLLATQPAAAQSPTACFADAGGLPGNIPCTANDVQTVALIQPANGDTCTSRTDTINLNITITWAANANRYDIGLFVAEDGGNAKTGECFQAVGTIPPFANLDGTTTPQDTCGDIAGHTQVTQTTFNVTVSCSAADSNNHLLVPACRTWKQPGANLFCDDIGDTAGTGSKCDCSAFTTDIVVPPDPCAGVNCDDSNPCTDDSCDAGACVHTNNTDPCDDATVCNGREVCGGGTCNAGTALDCNDGNVCTDDSCDPIAGCGHTNNTDPCNDGNACTTGDVCSSGTCVGGTPLVCDDGNVCTDDSCDPIAGCGHTNNTASCDDGDACTTPDVCSGGTCVGGPNICPTDTLILHTGTTCSDYTSISSTPSDFELNELLYTLRGGVINSVSPGVFFLYDGEHLTSTGSIVVTESDDSWTQIIVARQGQVVLYDVNCNKLNVGTVTIDPDTGTVTISGVPTGDYILGIKYDSTTLKGYSPPTASAKYLFKVTTGGGPTGNSGSDSINVNLKP